MEKIQKMKTRYKKDRHKIARLLIRDGVALWLICNPIDQKFIAQHMDVF